MLIAGIFFSTVYLVICAYLSSGRRLRRNSLIEPCKKSVSVIICARNEEKNIAKLLNCLLSQTYPKNLTQIIIIDDRSTDKTAEIVNSYKEKLENLQLIKIEKRETNIAPKKFAFSAGLKYATGEIIVQTDADSVVPSDWIEKLTVPFSDDEISLVQGIVKYRFDEKISPILRIYQTLDFASHGIVAAAAINKNIPLNANANNFAFRRKTYEELGGYGKLGNVVGGDDGLIMQNFWTAGKKICFNADTAVETQPEYSWKNLINQRKKWGSETQFYLPKQIVILVSIFIFYCFVLICPVLFLIKILGELFFLTKYIKFFADKKLLPHIIWVSPLNLFIVIFSVIAGIFGKFEWKGENFRGQTIR
jgi:cellulose synthase/poly-beta-1,6-N-acetylglucosamine synthase-like glycosyltransferase